MNFSTDIMIRIFERAKGLSESTVLDPQLFHLSETYLVHLQSKPIIPNLDISHFSFSIKG